MFAATSRVHRVELVGLTKEAAVLEFAGGRLTGVCDSLSDPKGEEDEAQRDHEEA
jgi:hypothetical protein